MKAIRKKREEKKRAVASTRFFHKEGKGKNNGMQ